MRNSTYSFRVWQDWGNDSYKVYLSYYDFVNGKNYFLTLKDGVFEKTEYQDGTDTKKPLFVLTKEMGSEAFPDLVKDLARNGYVVEVDNAERITSEALAKERDKELDFFKEKYVGLVNKIVEK